MGTVDSSKIIECYIDLSDYGNNYLFDRAAINRVISKDVSAYMDKYGLKYEILPLGGKGGGGGMFRLFGEGLKIAWDNREYIEAILALIKIAIKIPRFMYFLLNQMSFTEKPRVDINLGIELEDEISAWERNMPPLNMYLAKKMLNLKQISDDLYDYLSDKYTLFKFDRSLSIYMPDAKFQQRFSIKAEYNNAFNSMRLTKLIKNILVRKNFYSSIEFGNFSLVNREDGYMQVYGRARSKQSKKKYHLFVSSSVVRDHIDRAMASL